MKQTNTFNDFIKNHAQTHQLDSNIGEIVNSLLNAAVQIKDNISVAALIDITGHHGCENIHGEAVQKLDILSNTLIKDELLSNSNVGILASEEEDEHVVNNNGNGYVVMFDPLDGSSNIDVNVSVGTIFTIYKMIDGLAKDAVDHCLQAGRKQVAAGYILYGSSSQLVCTFGYGVFGFTLEPKQNAFLLSHDNLQIPEKTQYYSVNEGHYKKWHEKMQRYITFVWGCDEDYPHQPLSTRYVGSLVSDFHRNLLKGGIYLYPGCIKKPEGKLRLLYEGNPLAFICEQAGGAATDNNGAILDISPAELHQKVPLFIGNKAAVEQFHEIVNN